MGQKFFDMQESSRLNMSFNCSGAFNIIYIMRTSAQVSQKSTGSPGHFLVIPGHLLVQRLPKYSSSVSNPARSVKSLMACISCFSCFSCRESYINSSVPCAKSCRIIWKS
ncbi:hypothetical protein D9848_20470 [Salmonella enterica]|nr:hypothetical protein [Salmonella enterica]